MCAADIGQLYDIDLTGFEYAAALDSHGALLDTPPLLQRGRAAVEYGGDPADPACSSGRANMCSRTR